MKRLLALLMAMIAFAAVPGFAQDDRDYTQGPVTNVTSVRVQEGQWDNYMAYLRTTYKPLMEEQKKAGIILGYSIHGTQARSVEDPNLYLLVTCPNMASFDGLDEKTEPLARKITGHTREQGAKASVERGAMRTILGNRLIREVILK